MLRSEVAGERDEDQAHIRLTLLAERVIRRKWRVLVCVLSGAMIGIVWGLLMQPVYKASIVVMPVEQRDPSSGLGGLGGLSGLGGLASLAGINLGGSSSVTYEALAVLQSREFAENYIQANNLLPDLFPDKWDARGRRWKVDAAHTPSAYDGWKLIHKRIMTVDRDEKTGLITLTMEWTDPVAAARWANGFIAEVNGEMRARAIQSANDRLGYLEKELTTTRAVEVRSAVESLMELEEQRRMLATVNLEYAFKTVDRAIPANVNDPVIKRRVVVALGILFGITVGLMIALFDWL